MSRMAKIVTALLILIGGASYLAYKIRATSQLESLYVKNKNYAVQTALFDLYATERAEVVMLGNSLTQWVDWNALLGRKNIANRGIASDVTAGYLHRLEQIYKLKPKLCFIEGGINDLYANVSVDGVYENYVKIVEALKANGIIPVIQSTLFVSPKWHDAVEKNKEVAELNSLLQNYARKNGIEFLNLNAVMSTNNVLRDELTHDGVHLTAAGYRIWGKEVEKELVMYGL
jgi:lysophospholipase L1-like esterase